MLDLKHFQKVPIRWTCEAILCLQVDKMRGKSRNRISYFWPENLRGTSYRTYKFCSAVVLSRRPIIRHQLKRCVWFIAQSYFRSNGPCTKNSCDTASWKSRSIFLTWEPQRDTLQNQRIWLGHTFVTSTNSASPTKTLTLLYCASRFRSDGAAQGTAVIQVHGNQGPYFWPENHRRTHSRTYDFCSPIFCRDIQFCNTNQYMDGLWFIAPSHFRSDDYSRNSRTTDV